MASNQHACEKCGEPVRIVPTIGDPTLDQWYCDNHRCDSRGRDQGPMLRGKNYNQQEFYPDGRVDVFQRGRESQGEANVPGVAAALVGHRGCGYCWEPRSGRGQEQGWDFVLIEPDGSRREVQVVRAVDQEFCAALGSDADHEARQSVTAYNFLGRVARAVRQKTRNTPRADRRERVLAVDVLDEDYAVYWATASKPLTWWDKAHRLAVRTGWRTIAVVGARKTWLLGSRGLLTQPKS